MRADTIFVGVRDQQQTAVFVVNASKCVSLYDYLAHHRSFTGQRLDWSDHEAASLTTAIALLTASTGRYDLAGQVAQDFLSDVVSQLEREGWELPAGAVLQYVELWVTCPARRHARPQPCYGCGDR